MRWCDGDGGLEAFVEEAGECEFALLGTGGTVAVGECGSWKRVLAGNGIDVGR